MKHGKKIEVEINKVRPNTKYLINFNGWARIFSVYFSKIKGKYKIEIEGEEL